METKKIVDMLTADSVSILTQMASFFFVFLITFLQIAAQKTDINPNNQSTQFAEINSSTVMPEEPEKEE